MYSITRRENRDIRRQVRQQAARLNFTAEQTKLAMDAIEDIALHGQATAHRTLARANNMRDEAIRRGSVTNRDLEQLEYMQSDFMYAMTQVALQACEEVIRIASESPQLEDTRRRRFLLPG